MLTDAQRSIRVELASNFVSNYDVNIVRWTIHVGTYKHVLKTVTPKRKCCYDQRFVAFVAWMNSLNVERCCWEPIGRKYSLEYCSYLHYLFISLYFMLWGREYVTWTFVPWEFALRKTCFESLTKLMWCHVQHNHITKTLTSFKTCFCWKSLRFSQ